MGGVVKHLSGTSDRSGLMRTYWGVSQHSAGLIHGSDGSRKGPTEALLELQHRTQYQRHDRWFSRRNCRHQDNSGIKLGSNAVLFFHMPQMHAA